ncbi:Pre-mRNA-splicing factor cwc21 [Talaromyces atroroseus]|uniref:Pre-mRNA-splicing factor cwc21 n=1 Tax=Talaromyces atroroseus TaxID=1441469 RepID=A0A1Q5QA02_TALAT|nr:Pre-mRNA-splicing factor cwc21 [Talaromyces atroroseus]OKL62755.1 Pre-mRNA-splicing factor cwc21 [Talaromyces atroroseus]
MSSNVGLSTPRGSGTSGYVQRNSAFLKPRNAGYGAPYPPVPSSSADTRGINNNSQSSGFRQRKPDQQILEHDRKRAIELQVLEERERLEEESEELEKSKKKGLTDEEIDEKCDALRERLLKELQEGGRGREGYDAQRRAGRQSDKDRRQFKSYQVHELAEAKIQESERLRKALGIKEDWEKDANASSFSKDKNSEEKEGKSRNDIDERDLDYSSAEDDRRKNPRRRHS